jgi:putative membrane protein
VPEEIGGVRDHLANERTQLAWLRTGANVMVVGLAVARFGGDGDVTPASLAAGGVLVLAGVFLVAFGTYRYRWVARELTEGVVLTATLTRGPTWAAAALLSAMLIAGLLLMFA